MIEKRVVMLKIINRKEHSVREVIKLANSRYKDTITLLKSMEQEGLIYFPKDNGIPRKRGRPKKVPKSTILGEQLLMDFQRCKRNIIQINDNDLKHCMHQVALRRLLEENNVSPYQRLQELNNIAFHIRNSINY